MPKGEIPSQFPEENDQQFETILSALQILSVAVAGLPGASLQIGNLETGPGAILNVTPGKELTVKYKPGETIQVHQSQDTDSGKPEKSTPVYQYSPAPPVETAPQKEGERVTLTGRLAYEPFFKKTKAGMLRVRMGLAVPDETVEAKVKYEQIYTTGKYAEKVQEAGFHKGNAVQVVGYEQYRQSKDKDGSEKMTKQIYAVAVKPTGKKTPPK